MKAESRSPKDSLRILVALVLFTSPLLQTTLSAQQTVITENAITYGKGGDIELKLDLARPSVGKGPFPALVFIHGDGWISGNRDEFDFPIQKAAENGYVAVTVDYRLTNDSENARSKSIFPAQLYDVKSAVRWLRTNASKYNIDASHIGVFGFSAGAYLALMLGLTKPSDGLEGEGQDGSYSSAVQAVVSCGGPTDFSVFHYEAVQRLIGGTLKEVPDKYKKASPVTYVRRDSPPVLILNGDKDDTVPVEQAEILDSKMKEVGAVHLIIIEKGAGHQSFHTEKAVWAFFDKHLKSSWWSGVLRWFGM